MNLLNESCKFQCMLGNPSILITASEQGNQVARDSRRKVLTTKAKCEVKTPLPCSFLTAMAGGTPTNCQLSQTEWMGASSRLKCNGNNVLTDMSSVMCVYGGVIKPVGTSCVGRIGAVVEIADISVNAETKTYAANNGYAVEHSDVDNAGYAVDYSDTANAGNEVVYGDAGRHDYDTDHGAVAPGGDRDQKSEQEAQGPDSGNEHTDSIYASHTMCDYENCDERDTCGYFSSQIYMENSSAKLRKNFQTGRKSEWEQYLEFHNRKNGEVANGGWGIAAHHMISGNQVLMMKDESGALLYGVLVKLANYFEYDVNNEWNGIMLPTNESASGANCFGKKETVLKSANAYEAMWAMGRQWHVGGHKYSLEEGTLKNLSDFYKKHPEQYPSPGNPDFFTNYITAMKEEMDTLLMKYSRMQCWKKNYERKQQKFWKDMNGLSSKVETYLLRFGSNPRMSFPFFVSKAAVEYAYDLPATSKLVVVYQKGAAIRAKRIRAERYMKNDLKIVPVEKEDIEIKDSKQFICFCENVMHFLIDSRLKDYPLPFCRNADVEAAVRTVDFQGEDVMKYLMDHGNEIVAFVNQNEYARQPIATVVARRGGM